MMSPSQIQRKNAKAARKASGRLNDRRRAMKVASLISEGGKLLDMTRENSGVRWKIHRKWPHLYNKDGSRRINGMVTDYDQPYHAIMRSGETEMFQAAGEIKNCPILLDV